MSRKDFVAIANIINKYTDPGAAAGYDEGVSNGAAFVADELADYLATTNQNFDRERFLTACGVGK